MKKEIPLILLESAKKHGIVPLDDHYDEFASSLLEKLSVDECVTKEHLLAISELSEGTGWVDNIHEKMLDYTDGTSRNLVTLRWMHPGFYQYSQIFSNLENKFELICRSERALRRAVREIFNRYNREYEALKNLSLKPSISINTIVQLGIRWPRLASGIIKACPKDKTHLEAISPLMPNLIRSMEEGDIPSLETYAFLALTGLGLPTIQKDLAVVEECCALLILKGHSTVVNIIANALAKGEIPKILNKSDEFMQVEFQKCVEKSYYLYNRIIESENCIVGKNFARAALKDPEFQVDLAVYFQRHGKLEQAIELYDAVIQCHERDDNSNVDQVVVKDHQHNIICERIPELMDIAAVNSAKAKKVIVSLVPETYLRLGMIWCDRLNLLNQDPSTDPKLCLRLSHSYFEKGSIVLSRRLYVTAITHDPTLLNKEFSLKLGREHDLNELVLFEKAKVLLTRLDIVEYILPFYRKASDLCHVEAQLLLKRLELEFNSLKAKDQDIQKWDPRLTRTLSAKNLLVQEKTNDLKIESAPQ